MAGLIRDLLGIQDPRQRATMQAHALDMQIKQAQLQKLLAGGERDTLGDQKKQADIDEANRKAAAIGLLGGGGGGMPQGGALAGYAPMQTGGAHLNEDGSEVSSPEQEAIWQQNNGGFSTGGIQVDELPSVTPLQGLTSSQGTQQIGSPDLPPEVLGAIGAIAPSALGNYYIDKPKRDQDYIKNQREAAMQQTDLSKAFSTYAEENLRSKQLLDKVMPQVSNWTAGTGSLLRYIPGTGARDLEANVDTLRAGELIDALKQLKQESPNGASGLGALTDKEGSALKALRANLETTQSPEQLKENMSKLSEFMDKSFERVSKAYEEHQKAFGAQGSPVLDATKAERKQYQDSRSALEAELAKRGLKVKK